MNGEMLGGFFVICRWTGDIYQTEYQAVQSLGYDVATKKYSGSWVDSIMSYRWQFEGDFETNSQELVFLASGPGHDGNTTKFRERYQFKSDDAITVIAEVWQKEKWVAFMQTHLNRMTKKKAE